MPHIVRAKKIAYRYPQNNHDLAPISLTIWPGEHVLVTGPSDHAKSTLARCLTDLIPHLYCRTLAGTVWLDGLRAVDNSLRQLTEQNER